MKIRPTTVLVLAACAAGLPPAGARDKAAPAPAPVPSPAASIGSAPPAGWRVNLRVTDEGNGRAIARARVDVFDARNLLIEPQRQTNREGRVAIDDLARGRYRLQISASDRQTVNLTLDLTNSLPDVETVVVMTKVRP